MSDKLKKERFAESIKVIEENDNYDIIFDDNLQRFILIDKASNEVFSATDKIDITKFATSKYGGN